MNKKRRDYNEIELAMTRIGLFIIPLAEERERDKADIKKCVVAGPTLTICHGDPMVVSQCMLIIAMGIKGASSLEIAPLKLQTPIRVHTKHRQPALYPEVTLAIDLAN